MNPSRRASSLWIGIRLCAVISLCGGLGLAAGAETEPLHVVISEVAWMGTAASSADEWIELANNTAEDVSLAGWRLESSDGSPTIVLVGTLEAYGFYLLERTDDTTVSDLQADQLYAGSLGDAGECLTLRDPAGGIRDSANADGGPWPAGSTTGRTTMERVNPRAAALDPNWRTNDALTRNGRDATGNPLNGTPRSRNSCTNPPLADFSFSPDPATMWDTVLFLNTSWDRDGIVSSWAWSFGDGASSSEPNPAHAFRAAGLYATTLTVTDNDGLVGRAVRELAVEIGRGDVDADGVADVVDVRLALQAALGLIDLPPFAFGQADVDQDRDLDLDDARRLALHLIGMSWNVGPLSGPPSGGTPVSPRR